jgi:phage terminase large subunit-like protein
MLQKTSYFLLLLFLFFQVANAQTWQYKGTKYGVKGYAYDSNGDFWFRGITTTNASLSACCAILRDANAYPKWAADILLAKHLKVTPSKMDYYTYAVLDFPWPMSDRDFILKGMTTQDPVSKVVSIKSDNVANFIAENSDYIRLKSYTLDIILSPVNNQTQIEMVFFIGKADNFPTWLLDLFLADKLYTSIDRFAKMSVQAPYKTAVLAEIKN